LFRILLPSEKVCAGFHLFEVNSHLRDLVTIKIPCKAITPPRRELILTKFLGKKLIVAGAAYLIICSNFSHAQVKHKPGARSRNCRYSCMSEIPAPDHSLRSETSSLGWGILDGLHFFLWVRFLSNYNMSTIMKATVTL
jgi:hypothetical protein